LRTTHHSLRRHRPRRTRIRLLSHATSTLRRALSLIRRRAKRTDFVGVDADGFVVFAEDDARDVFGYVLGAHVGMQRDVRGAFEVVGVLVEAHCSLFFGLFCWVGGVGGSCGARLVDFLDRYCCRSW
jgi:hypothetical protein